MSGYQAGWDDGYAAGLQHAETAARAAAFGAIRRAVTPARRRDEGARDHGRIIARMVENDPNCRNVGNPTCDQHRRAQTENRRRAESIRYAIRVAINSPYAHLESWQSRREP